MAAIACSFLSITGFSMLPSNMSSKAISRVVLQPPTKGSPTTTIFCMLNKVYEDQALGIVCYKDEKGELICEGYDEGPRIDKEPESLSSISYSYQSQVYKPDLFQHSRLPAMDEFCHSNNVFTGKHDARSRKKEVAICPTTMLQPKRRVPPQI